MSTVLLWLFVLNLGIAFGAGLYEHRIALSRWIESSPAGWNAELAREEDTGRRFWAFVTTGPLTLLTIANLVAAWLATGAVRPWWLAAAGAAALERAFTFTWFIPTMVRLLRATNPSTAAPRARRWRRLNYLRHAITLVSWLAALQALALL